MLDLVRKLLSSDGRLAQTCEGYEYREEQVRMAEAVAESLIAKDHLLVEAGTGVGKTIAYLIPAIFYAKTGKPVVISTHTINLQSQLLSKDIPMMKSVLDDIPFTAVLMKGRSNFLCLNELDHASASLIYQGDPVFDTLKKWANETESGDVSDLDFPFSDWHEVCANPDTCRHTDCPYYLDRCFYYNMRRAAENADILIVNHSLFMSNLGIRTTDPRGTILPDYGAVIFDEAHHLEDVASDIFGIEFSNYRVPMLLRRIGKRRDIAIPRGGLQDIETTNARLFEAFSNMRKSEYFFEEFYQSVDKKSIEDIANELVTQLDSLNTQLAGQDTDNNPELKDRIDGYRRMVGRMREELLGLFFASQPNSFKWAERPSNSKFINCCLHLSPVNVADILRDNLWGGADSVVCTSATLSNSGTFCYIKNRLGTPECNELVLGSPFDYMNQALLYVPEDLDIPSERHEYADTVAERIKELLVAVGGRAFMLFTSYRMLNAVFDRITDEVPYRLLKQGDMSNQKLISEFRTDDDTCLMGVHSFWEGVDVKGERLTCVIIDKLPFAVPDTPMNKARCEQIEREGGDWFREYAMPQAQIRLKQGFGRLIRTKSDYGVVAILDSRIHKRFYGREFLKYLPHCRGTKRLDKIEEFFAQSAEDCGVEEIV